MPDQGVSFRATAGFVTDGPDDTFCIGEPLANLYPTTRGGITFGWDNEDSMQLRDRDSGIDVRLAGLHGALTGVQRTWRLDLDGLGGATTYTITLAMGDHANDKTDLECNFQDDVNVLNTVGPVSTTSGARHADAVGATHSAANWPGSNSPYQNTWVDIDEIFRLLSGDGVEQGSIEHISFSWVAAAPSLTMATMVAA